jgi:SAM-dependent methyltransferase
MGIPSELTAGMAVPERRKRPAKRQLSLPALFGRLALMLLGVFVALVAPNYPWDTDAPLTPLELEKNRSYYATAYQKTATEAETEENAEYVAFAKAAAEKGDIRGHVGRFAAKYGLQDKKVLDLGAGRGYLQDVVGDYTGLDISPSVKRFFHKRFVLGSATAMPLADNEFDGLWTIWVLEHVPNPEAALVEMRRVVKNGGVMMVAPAWNCTPWAAQGYPVRPYSDFDWKGKLIKWSIPFRAIGGQMGSGPVSALREAQWQVTGGPTRLRYTRIEPNYEKYWMADSDAINRLTRDEMGLWFRSRGDECLNCDEMQEPGSYIHPLFIRVKK